MTNLITLSTESPYPSVYEVHGTSKTGTPVVLAERDGGREGWIWLPKYGTKAAQFDSWKTALAAAKSLRSPHFTYTPKFGVFNIVEAKSPKTVAYEQLIEQVMPYVVK